MEMKFRFKDADSYEHAKITFLKDVSELLLNNGVVTVEINNRDYRLSGFEIKTYDCGFSRDFEGNIYTEEPTHFVKIQFDEI